jgi:ribosomal-protein-alanine N-acetyltransferase
LDREYMNLLANRFRPPPVPIRLWSRVGYVPAVAPSDPRVDATIRTAVRADLLAVFRIEKRSFEQPWPYDAFESVLGAPAFFVAEGGGRIVGYVVGDTIDTRGTSIGHIKNLAVDPDCRREGIGTRLLARGLSTLDAVGVERVKLEVRRSNESAQSLYASFGFERHHTVPGYYEDGEDAYVLVRSSPTGAAAVLDR